jgi:DNA polymerase-3 subunit gamma/tau
VTVLSRCQRFDLRRIPAEKLAEHFAKVAEAEAAEADPEALALIARAAEGSVRDGLSILDQAIAHGHGRVDADAVRDMLGLSDRGRVRELMAALLAGDAPGALALLRAQYDLGVNPDMVMQELLELTHAVTRAKVARGEDAAMSEAEREAIADWGGRMGFPALHRLWQLLLKGLAEVQSAPVPIQAAEMALLRVIHASTMPDPGDLLKKLTEKGGDAPATPAPASAPEPAPEPAMLRAPDPVPLRRDPPKPETVAAPADFAGLVRLFETRREPLLAHILHDEARLVRYAPPLLDIAVKGQRPDFAQQLMRSLQLWTGERWTVTLSDAEGQPTLREVEAAAREAEREAVLRDPTVRRLFEAFPNAELVEFGLDPDAPDASSDADSDIRSA